MALSVLKYLDIYGRREVLSRLGAESRNLSFSLKRYVEPYEQEDNQVIIEDHLEVYPQSEDATSRNQDSIPIDDTYDTISKEDVDKQDSEVLDLQEVSVSELPLPQQPHNEVPRSPSLDIQQFLAEESPQTNPEQSHLIEVEEHEFPLIEGLQDTPTKRKRAEIEEPRLMEVNRAEMLFPESPEYSPYLPICARLRKRPEPQKDLSNPNVNIKSKRPAKNKARERQKMQKTFKICDSCIEASKSCEEKRPCERCVSLGLEARCIGSPKRKRGRPPKINGPKNLPSSSSSSSPSPASNSGLSTRAKQKKKTKPVRFLASPAAQSIHGMEIRKRATPKSKKRTEAPLSISCIRTRSLCNKEE